MTREDHIRFCKACNHQQYNPQKGIVCGLTKDIADFEIHCDHFEGDIEATIKIEPVAKEPVLPKIKHFFSYFIPTDDFFITPIILDVCISLFVFMSLFGVNMIDPAAGDLVWWGANVKSLTLDGQYWRVLTSCFLHIGIIHLLCNLYAMLYIGVILEPIIGKVKMAIAFVLCGIGGSVASLLWHDDIISAGASGAIFGLTGILIVLLATGQIEVKNRINTLCSLVFFVLINLIYGLNGDIDNAAHIGGLLVGLVYGLTLLPSIQNSINTKVSLLINSVSPVLIALLFIICVLKTPNAIGNYNALMFQFAEKEALALKVYQLPESSSDRIFIRSIERDGIPNWEKCKSIIAAADSIPDLPDEYGQRIELLDRYCDYRIEVYKLHQCAIKNQSAHDDYSITKYNTAIENIILKLQGQDITDKDMLVTKEDLIRPNYNTNNNSVTFNDEMLYVIDGVVSSQSLTDIKPEDISSLTILKSEQAKQIYGKRGENGVIIITTKKNARL